MRYRNRRSSERGEQTTCVRHDIADDVDPAHDALAFEGLPRAVVRAEEEPREAIRLDPVALLRHVEVAAAQPRLHVRERDRRVCRGTRAGERRVRVAVDEDDVGRFGSDPFRDRGLHRVGVGGVEIEPVARLGEAELVEEDLGHGVEPVLPRVQDDLFDARIAECRRQRRCLDELRAVPDDGEHLHATKPTSATRA